VWVVKTIWLETRRIASERAVAFVQVDDPGVDAERGEGAHPANPEQQFLTDADSAVTAVEARGELAIFRLIAFDIGVEEQQGAATDRQLPYPREQRSGTGIDADDDRFVRRSGGLNRQVIVLDPDVFLGLPAVRIEPLAEVALVIEQPDPDKRNAKVGCALDVIAGEDAEAAGVDRN
jgi:hypothetical protein